MSDADIAQDFQFADYLRGCGYIGSRIKADSAADVLKFTKVICLSRDIV